MNARDIDARDVAADVHAADALHNRWVRIRLEQISLDLDNLAAALADADTRDADGGAS
jgi:hypothetical protein